MMRTPHILVVEDDREIRTMVSRFLQKQGYRVTQSEDARSMDKALAGASIDLVLLDIMLPGGEDGLSICRRLRASSSVPIIMLTAAGDTTARVVGLEMGADDYIAKPFDPQELAARTKAVLRRAAALPGRLEQPMAALSFDGWRIEPVQRELHAPDGARVTLTGAEFDLLLAFCRHPQRTLSRDQLLDLSQGRGGGPLDRGIDILVSRIRRKIETNPRDPRLIKTVRTGGYIFTPPVFTLPVEAG
ncbi:response regulator [Reyranella soli]|jgi:two-component system OmpR family response regulator|uniref:Regulatory protein VirG n=1 Tax=Reyranella soli TaxID=1230389 RepID=A0A512N6D5_9HYPH|nr:response regulator [Reyranella soli]GEP54545.1 DNA-binding response regulator [Reyranella soli]